MHAAKTIAWTCVFGVAVFGGCEKIAGVPGEVIRDDSVASGAGSSSTSSGGGQPCGTPADCGGRACNGGFCCDDPMPDVICKDVCGNVTSPCGVNVPCGCAPPNLCGGGGVAGKCGCVACPIWQKEFGLSTTGLNAAALALDSTGGIVLAGDFSSSINFGGGDINALQFDAFLGKLKGDGTYGGWGKTLGTSDSILQTTRAVAIDGTGNVYVAGEFKKSINFGTGPEMGPTTASIYVAKFDNAGQHLWHKVYGSSTGWDQHVTDLVVDAKGDPYLVGDFAQDLNFGSGPLTYVGGRDVYVAKLGNDGAEQWSKSFPYQGDQFATGVTVNSTGDIYVSGHLQTGIDFGGSVGVKMSKGGKDGFVMHLDGMGVPVSGTTLGDGSDQVVDDIAHDAADNILITGTFQGTIDFGSGITISSTTVDNVFVAQLDAMSSSPWAKAFGGKETTRGGTIASASNGDILLMGTSTGAPDFGGGPRDAYYPGMYLVRLNKDGNHVWSKGNTVLEAAGGKMVNPFAIAESPDGKIVVGVIVAGQLDFGLGPITSNNAVGNIVLLQLNGL